MLYRGAEFLPTKSMLCLYNSFFLSNLNYCLVIWSYTTESNINRLLVLQKRAIRIITNSKLRDHTSPLFKKLSLLPLMSLVNLKKAIFMYSIINKSLPNIILYKFIYTTDVHEYNTRQKYFQYRTNLKLAQQTIFFDGPKFWENIVPTQLKNCSKNAFKRKYKKLLLSQT